MRNGSHYHQGYGNAEYEQGLRDGRADVSRDLPWNAHHRRYRTEQARREYENGYNDGYRGGSEFAREKPGYGYGNNGYGYGNNSHGYYGAPGAISVDRNDNVSWRAPIDSRIYVQVDNQTPKLFASGQTGVQPAPWMQSGHIYTFIMQDVNGNEIGRTVRDLR
jgi:hypothetical protein